MKKIYCCPLPFLAACFLLLYALAVFLAQSPWRDISFVPHPSGVRAVSLGDAGGALEADGMYFFSAAHSLNCWDGRSVRTLILPAVLAGSITIWKTASCFIWICGGSMACLPMNFPVGGPKGWWIFLPSRNFPPGMTM